MDYRDKSRIRFCKFIQLPNIGRYVGGYLADIDGGDIAICWIKP